MTVTVKVPKRYSKALAKHCRLERPRATYYRQLRGSQDGPYVFLGRKIVRVELVKDYRNGLKTSGLSGPWPDGEYRVIAVRDSRGRIDIPLHELQAKEVGDVEAE